MKRFLVFETDDYYPSGGALDFLCDVDTIDEVLAAIKPNMGGANVLDTATARRYVYNKETISLDAV